MKPRYKLFLDGSRVEIARTPFVVSQTTRNSAVLDILIWNVLNSPGLSADKRVANALAISRTDVAAASQNKQLICAPYSKPAH